MSEINWIQLKEDFLLGNYKTITEFARNKGLKQNGYFYKKTKGWGKEKGEIQKKKSSKIVRIVSEQEIKNEVKRNDKHIQLWDILASRLESYLRNETYFKGIKSVYLFKHIAETIDKLQRGHRLAEGMDVNKDQENSNMAELIAALDRSRELNRHNGRND